MNYKITLDEFLKSPVPLCIHCRTEEEFKTLAHAYDRVSLNWWKWYKDTICCTNVSTYASIEYFKDKDIPIFEFDEVYIPPIEDKEEILIERIGNLTTATYKKDGVMINDNGCPTPNGGAIIRTFADWTHFTSSKFIEIVE